MDDWHWYEAEALMADSTSHRHEPWARRESKSSKGHGAATRTR
jgi:hypothetical protein